MIRHQGATTVQHYVGIMASASLVALLGGCGGEAPDKNGVPATALLGGPDVFVDAVVEDVFAVGGVDAEGWDAFSRVDDAEFDSEGNLIILDTRNLRLVVIGPDGAFRREVSRGGAGPGELRAPASIVVLPDDRLVVYDFGHNAFLTFDPDGTFLEQYPANPDDDGPSLTQGGLVGRGLHALPDGRLVVTGLPQGGPHQRNLEVQALGERRRLFCSAWRGTDSDDGAEQVLRPTGSNLRVRGGVLGALQAFGPPLLTAVLTSEHVVVVDSTGYRVKFVAPDGSLAQVVERPIQPLPVTASLREAEMSRRAEWQGAEAGGDNQVLFVPNANSNFRISTEQLDAIVSEVVGAQLAQTTFGPEVPVIAALAVDSQDRIWVGRTASDGADDGPTDVLTPQGSTLVPWRPTTSRSRWHLAPTDSWPTRNPTSTTRRWCGWSAWRLCERGSGFGERVRRFRVGGCP